MAIYSTFVYGTGVLYGPAVSITSVDPARGPSTGGNDFVIDGSGFANSNWSSFFEGAVLDPAKFSDISAGTGTATTNSPNLVLASGAVAGGSGAIESVASWTDAQSEIVCYIPSVLSYPSAEVELVSLHLYIDATNYTKVGIYLGTSSSTLVLRADVVRGGSTLSTYEEAWTSGTSKLKILRWGTTVYVYANGALFHKDTKFINTLATYRVSCSNTSTTYSVSTRVSAFYWRPFVLFDGRPVHDPVVVSEGRIRGVVPPSWDDKGTDAAYSGTVDVSVVGVGTYTSTDAYEYYYVDQLTVINNESSSIKVSFLSDSLLRTPSSSLRGLGTNKS